MSQSDDHLLSADAQGNAKQRTNTRFLTTACVSLVVLALTGLVFTGLWTQASLRESYTPAPSLVLSVEPNVTEPEDPYDTSNFVRGKPSLRFRDNILPEYKYITSWISAGWTNDVITFMNLIYLALITERIPVIPMFVPTHIGSLEQVPPLPFGEVFDIPALRTAIQSPVIEWHEVKSFNSHEVEDIGCWNVWQTTQAREDFPRRSVSPYLLQLDISYTQAPPWIKLIPEPLDPHTSFWDLAVLAFPEGRKESLREPRESEVNKVRLPPDEHMLCYDYLYFVSAKRVFEIDNDYSPSWRFVGRHLRWSQRVKQLVDEYVRRTIGVPDEEKTPAWISVHVRRGDFAGWCGDVPPIDCFAPLSVFARRVDEVKKELLDTRGIVVDNVIMTSDERDPAWWDDVQSRGWLRVNHTDTVQNYGEWFPVLIDAGIQSSGMGFVGTDRSTMSILARRRVQSWQEGVVRTVKWGSVGADDH